MKLTVNVESKQVGQEMNAVFKFDYATVRRLYNCPFIDHDKVMTGEEFLDGKKIEAKEILINQMKR